MIFSWWRSDSNGKVELESMKPLIKSVAVLLLFTALLQLTPSLRAESIFVSNDEWMFGNCCLALNNDAQFASNIANWLTGGSGTILIASNNFGLGGSGLESELQGLGYTVVENANPVSLAGYDAVFVGGSAVDNTMLTDYVNGGGNVFVEAGTGCCGGAPGEAGTWNPFLNAFGMNLATNYNNVGLNVDVSAFQSQGPYGSALFSGVNTVYINNGNNVSMEGVAPNVQIFSDANGNGLYGAWQGSVPEPSSLMGFVGLLLVLGLAIRRRQSARAEG